MPEGSRRHCFVIEAREAPDTLLRVLTPFSLQGARLASVVLEGDRIRVEADGLDAQSAEVLLRRLRKMPVVTGVALGWRQAATAA